MTRALVVLLACFMLATHGVARAASGCDRLEVEIDGPHPQATALMATLLTLGAKASGKPDATLRVSVSRRSDDAPLRYRKLICAKARVEFWDGEQQPIPEKCAAGEPDVVRANAAWPSARVVAEKVDAPLRNEAARILERRWKITLTGVEARRPVSTKAGGVDRAGRLGCLRDESVEVLREGCRVEVRRDQPVAHFGTTTERWQLVQGGKATSALNVVPNAPLDFDLVKSAAGGYELALTCGGEALFDSVDPHLVRQSVAAERSRWRLTTNQEAGQLLLSVASSSGGKVTPAQLPIRFESPWWARRGVQLGLGSFALLLVGVPVGLLVRRRKPSGGRREVRRSVKFVFVASPSDLVEERAMFPMIVEHINTVKAHALGYDLQAVGWKDTLPGVGRPQALINEDLKNCDLFVMLLWKRWGTAPGGEATHTSGTEEEFELSRARNAESRSPDIFLYFRDVPPSLREAPDEQLARVLAFKAKVDDEKLCLYNTYPDASAWRDLFTNQLAAWVDRLPALSRG